MSEFDHLPNVFKLAKQKTGKDLLTFEEFQKWNNIYCQLLTDEQTIGNICNTSGDNCNRSGGVVVVVSE